MILGASNHPVLIKKIKLNIWCLRDELEEVVKSRLIQHQKNGNKGIPSIEDLIEEYSAKELEVDPNFKSELEIVEDESEDSLEENSEEEQTDENIDQQASSIVEGQTEQEVKKTSTIFHRCPKLARNKVHSGEAILSEIDMQSFNFFSNHKFVSGQSIVIEFLVPKRFIINADIIFSRSINMHSRIISEKRHPYRIAAKFSFLRPGERTLLRNFVSSIEPDISEVEMTPQTQKITAAEEESDDLDDLDDFDL